MVLAELNALISLYLTNEGRPIFITSLVELINKPEGRILNDIDFITLINLFFKDEQHNKDPILRQIMSSILNDAIEETTSDAQLTALESLVSNAPMMLILNIANLRQNHFEHNKLLELANSMHVISLEDKKYAFFTMQRLWECDTLDECIGVLMQQPPAKKITPNAYTMFKHTDFGDPTDYSANKSCLLF